VRRFIPNFAELVKHIASMLKKGLEIKWIDSARKSFESIKKAIMEAPTLISSDYSKEFHIFLFPLMTPLQQFYCKQMKKAESIRWHFSAKT